MEKQFSTEDLKNFYTERLGNIASKKELEAALEAGRVNLELNLDEFVSPERREEILRGNPDSIEILGINRQIQYGYDDGNKKFTATIKIPAADILKLQEAITLPSGRIITFEVVSEEGKNYVQFFGTNLEELKEQSRQFLIKKAWDEWRNSGKAPQDQRLENFDLFAELPPLPEPIPFGTDPESGEQLFAYPAITVESSYGTGNKYTVRFFPSQEEATQAQSKVLKIIEQATIERRNKEEKERLLAPARELLQNIKMILGTIGYNYESFGLSYSEKGDITNRLQQAEMKLASDTKAALEILQNLNEQLIQALDYKEQRRLAKEKADAAIGTYYGICPLCGRPMENRKCSNSEHNIERIDYDFDEEGNETGPVIISQLTTNQGKIIAQLRCSYGEGKGRYRRARGDIYMVSGSDIGGNVWQGEPFESLKFEDFKKILTPEEAEKRKLRLETIRQERELAEARAHYQAALKYAREQVEQGYWRRGRFIKGIHPKTGEEQWQLTLKSRGLIVKYIVDSWSRQPTSEDAIYFYSEGKTLIDTGGFRLILVNLENPFPEDKPPEPESPSAFIETEPATSKSLTASLEELKKKWGAK